LLTAGSRGLSTTTARRACVALPADRIVVESTSASPSARVAKRG